jgi:ribosomal protein L14
MTAKAEEATKRGDKAQDLVVISPLKSWTCAECSGTGDLLTMDDAGPLCLSCADLDHLVYLPVGDAALTRRAKRASVLSAVVVRFSRSRRRYERQGVLVEEDALNRAERECLADEESRARRKLREGERRAEGDAKLQARAAAEIRCRYPGCPQDRAEEIAHHAFTRGSGRIGRTAAGRDLDPEALNLAVAAAVRHVDTPYDELLMGGMDRLDARAHVRAEVEQVMTGWQEPPAQTG